MKYLILGAGGQLATALEEALAGEEVLSLARAQADVCDANAVRRFAREFRPDFLVNTAAFRRVEDCEDQPGPSFAVNAAALRHLAAIANEWNTTLVHFSTDYVFDGLARHPYSESDVPHPLSVYAISKFAGEQIVCRYARNYYLVRTCGLYGRRHSAGKGDNFVDRMLQLARAGQPIRVVSDQIAGPTNAKDLAAALAGLLRSGKYGLYHMTNAGECSWFEFAEEIFRLAGLRPKLEPVTSAEFAAKARRPRYSVLENRALREAGLPALRPWRAALAEYLEDRGQATGGRGEGTRPS